MTAHGAMDDHSQQDFERFILLIAPWRDAYNCATNSYVALRFPEGPRLLFGRVLLEPTRPRPNQQTFRFETQHITAGRSVTGLTKIDLEPVFNDIRAGKMPRTDGTVSLMSEEGRPLSTLFNPFYHPLVPTGPRLPSVLVRGVSKQDLTAKLADATELDWELKAAEVPFDSLDELLLYCGLPTRGQMGDLTNLEVVAQSPAMIGPGSIVVQGEAILEVRVALPLDVVGLRIGYRAFSKERVDRGNVSGAVVQWRQEDDVRVGTCRIPVADSSLVQVFLSYADIYLHQWWVTDPKKRLNPRHAIHQVFDEDLESLRRMLLRPESDKSYVFENAVSTLLSVLGFSVSNYGRIPKLQKGPDVIAISPSGHIGVVECTIGLLDENDKLAKLVQRTKLVREKLNEAGYAHIQLLSVIVTPLPRDEVAANIESAGRHHIAVVCREVLEGLLNQVSLPLDPDKIFEDAKKLIPSSPQVPLFEEPAS